MPSDQGKGPAEAGTEGSSVGSRHQPRPCCLPAKPRTTAAALCFALPHPGQVAPMPCGWAAWAQREVLGRARAWVPSGNGTAPGYGVWCNGRQVAGSVSSSPRSAQRSPVPQLRGFGGVFACAGGEQTGDSPARLFQSQITAAALFSCLCNTHRFLPHAVHRTHRIPGMEHRLQGN